MPRKQISSRLYTRTRGGVKRFYADLRGFADVLREDEARRRSLETSDPDVAAKALGELVQELEQRRRHKDLLGVEKATTLGKYAPYHLEQKAATEDVADSWLETVELHLKTALEFFGTDRDPGTILPEHVQQFSVWLANRPNRRGAKLTSGTRRQYLNSLSNLYRRLGAEGYVLPGFNPVRSLMDKPKIRREEARWLEVPDAALYLEAARRYRPVRSDSIAGMQLHAIVAGYLLTGAREDELLGLELDDISFDRRTVTFRPNSFRRLKTATSHRVVPLWPQLEEIWRAWVFGGSGPRGRLLFPSPRVRQEIMITDLRKSLDAVACTAGWKPGEIRTKMFRHTYCAARLQTLDRGAPVSAWTVSREMGHGGRALVDRVYGHIGATRHRSEVVEYRIEQHAEQLRDRLALLPTPAMPE